MSAGVVKPTAAEVIARHKALPRSESDPRPLGVRLAQALCDDGFDIDEAVTALIGFAAMKVTSYDLPAVSVRCCASPYSDYEVVAWIPSD